MEVLDLFETCYGRFNELVRKTYLTAINSAPKLWQAFYEIVDNTSAVEGNLILLGKMRRALADLLKDADPDVVVTTFPVYNYLIADIYAGQQKPFSHLTVVTDSISINSIWYKADCDYYLVPNEPTARVLLDNGVPSERLKVFGFPVQTIFAKPEEAPVLPDPAEEKRVLYIINSGKSKAPKIVERLLEIEDIKLTVTVGRSEDLRREIETAVRGHEKRVEIFGWTTRIPQLLMSHHVVISKAGGATTQEAIAARCPMISNQVVPGQEEGNFEVLRMHDVGMLAEKPKEIRDAVLGLFADNATRWRGMRERFKAISIPDSSIRIAHFILQEAVPPNAPNKRLASLTAHRDRKSFDSSAGKKLLLCDLHCHSTFSDGKMTVSELVDFYGQRGFDTLCITDHLADHKTMIGKVVSTTGLVLRYNELGEYFEVLAKERERAMKKYGLLLLTGLEFNKDGYTANSSAHLLGVDLKAPIDPRLEIKELIHEIQKQGGLAIAAHPHRFNNLLNHHTLYLWENQDEYAPLLDAWEIANRNDIFNPVGLKRLPFVANSDLHKPKHIYSWKTMLFCEKNPEAIKECVRRNRDVAITLYRDHRFGYGFGEDAEQRPERELMFPHLHSHAA